MKKPFTLIELMAGIVITLLMMTILFQTFIAGADIASSQTTKVEIMADAGIFFAYITDDINNIDIDSIEQLKDKNNAEKDPINNGDTNQATGSQLYYSSTKIGFFSDVQAYDSYKDPATGADLVTELAGNKPFVLYEYIPASKCLVRTMMSVDNFTTSHTVSDDSPVILEGVEAFSIKVWDDYAGGTQLSSSPLATKPACITVSVTLTTPNPTASADIAEKQKRTISKTIYIDR